MVKLNGKFGSNLSFRNSIRHSNGSKRAKIYLLGSQGYIGSNLKRKLESKGIPFMVLDSRSDKFQGFSLDGDDLVLDCSRIKTFDQNTIFRDQQSHIQVLNWVLLNDGRYLRIGSSLEITHPIINSSYVKWSRSRTEITKHQNSTGKLNTLLVPNIFGGQSSTSIIDLMLKELEIIRTKPLIDKSAYREFLHFSFLENIIYDLFRLKAFTWRDTALLTSGREYQIGSIHEYLSSGGKTLLIHKEVEAQVISKTLYCEDILEDELQRHLREYFQTS